MTDVPPKPVLVLNLGVIGHRLRRGADASDAFDSEAVEKTIERVISLLLQIMDELHQKHFRWFAAAPPILACNNSLGEGADRIAARTASRLGVVFDAILPSAQPLYEATFEDDASRADFCELLGKARSVLQLPAIGQMKDGNSRARSFEQAAFTLLAQSDLLLAVWDGDAPQGLGGTGQTVNAAAQTGVPIIVIDPKGNASLRDFGDEEFPLLARYAADLPIEVNLEAGLRRIVAALIEPPGALPETEFAPHRAGKLLREAGWPKLGSFLERTPVGEEEREGLRLFLATPQQRMMKYHAWKWLRTLLLLRLDCKPPHSGDLTAMAPEMREAVTDPKNYANFQRLQQLRATADAVGKHYADAFRSAFVVNFLFGAAAVLCVASSLTADKQWSKDFAVPELGFVFIVVIVTLFARGRQWRRRWFEAREVAERFRASEPFWSLGFWPQSLHARQPGWPGWYARAFLREMPVFNGDLGFLLGRVSLELEHLVQDQINYHKKTELEAERSDRWLERIGSAILFLSLIVLAIEIAAFFDLELPARHELATKFFAVILPAFATAVFGIRLLGDFEDTALRSKRALTKLKKLIVLIGTEPQNLPQLRTRARQTAKTMLADLESWRVAVESRNIST